VNAPTTAPLGAVTTVIPDNCEPDGVGVSVGVGLTVGVGVGGGVGEGVAVGVGVTVGVDVAVGVAVGLGVGVGVGAAAVSLTNLATEGTRVEFKMKSM